MIIYSFFAEFNLFLDGYNSLPHPGSILDERIFKDNDDILDNFPHPKIFLSNIKKQNRKNMLQFVVLHFLSKIRIEIVWND